MQALPPGKSDLSNSFRQPRNHYLHLSSQLTTTARLLFQRKRSAQTNGQNWIPWFIGACLAGGSLVYALRAKTCACAPVLRRWRQAPRPKSRIPNRRLAPTPTIWNKTMTTPATDGKMLVNALYHSAVVSGLAAGYARLGKMAMGVAPRSLTLRPATLAWSWWTSLSPWRPKTC